MEPRRGTGWLGPDTCTGPGLEAPNGDTASCAPGAPRRTVRACVSLHVLGRGEGEIQYDDVMHYN